MLLGPPGIVFDSHIPFCYLAVRKVIEIGLGITAQNGLSVRTGRVTRVEVFIVGENDLLVFSDTKVHLKSVDTQLHGIEHRGKRLLRIKPHATPMSLDINNILGSLGYGLSFFLLRSGAVMKRGLHRIMIGDKWSAGISLPDNLKFITT